MSVIEYSLEVYEPGSADDVWVAFSSTTPFMPIQAGDILNPGLWPNSNSPMRVLRVINIEHFIWEARGDVKHKVLIFTEEVEGTRELRLQRR